LSWSKGSHDVMAGFEFRRLATGRAAVNSARGIFTFNGTQTGYAAADFILGSPVSFSSTGPEIRGRVAAWRDGFFVLDKWQVSRKLTLNYGIRYELPTVPYTISGNASFLNADQSALIIATPGTKFIKPQHKNFAPRVGFAYRINDKTTFRGGAGIYYNPNQMNSYTFLTNNPPVVTILSCNWSSGLPALSLSNPAAVPAACPVPGGPISGVVMTPPFDQPTQTTGVSFRQSATDANNHSVATVGALYVQDQVELSRRWQAVAGVRVDRFAVRFHDHRTDADLSRVDRLVSPRAGLIYKPVEPMSIYASYGVSQLPSAGDQFSSLTATSETLRPERFDNYELGAKWDATGALSLSGALYRLDRSNSAAHDPLDATRTVQTGAQRTTGWELGVTGRLAEHWDVVGGVARQRAVIVNATTAAPAGAAVPLVPRLTASLWNRIELSSTLGAGLGVVRQGAMYAAIDNSVTLPAFTRADGALFLTLPANLKAQLNLENLFGTRYYATAQGNNNILPGAGRTVRFSVAAGW